MARRLVFATIPQSAPSTGRGPPWSFTDRRAPPAIHPRALVGPGTSEGSRGYALDIRGHGTSGTPRRYRLCRATRRRPCRFFVAEIRKNQSRHSAHADRPFRRRRICATRRGNRRSKSCSRATVLLATLSRVTPRQPTIRTPAAWANRGPSAYPRPDGVYAASESDCCEALRCWHSRCRRIRAKALVPVYTDRLRLNFGTHRDYRTDLAGATGPPHHLFGRGR